jgi:creatinine amidohydrolase
MLRPGEIITEKERCPIVYLPVGPLEWHGPHLPMGMDALNAQAVSVALAKRNGGVVMPTLYFGTERERRPEMLRNIGFTGDEWIVGMDFPNNAMPSLYAKEEIFALTVRQYLRLLVEQGYKLIVIVNGHGAENHIAVLRRLAAEFTATTPSKVYYTITTFLSDGAQDFGHATRMETSIMAHLHPECVDTSTLPPKGEKIRNVDYAIVDHDAFVGQPNADFTVMHDPREYDAAEGKRILEYSVNLISGEIQKLL